MTTDQRQRPSGLRVVSIALVIALVVIAGGVGAFVFIQSRSSSEDLTMSHPLPEISRGDRGPARQDLEPLTKRFEALGSPQAATWQGGVLDARAPGPSTYWIEAVIHLDQGRGAQLVAEHPGAPVAAPVVDEALTKALPDGPWVASAELDHAFEADGYSGRVFVAPDDDTVVLLTIRQP